jgi:hypothetical protein
MQTNTCIPRQLMPSHPAAAIAGPVAAVLAAVLVTWIYIQSRASGRNLLGAVVPPGMGPSTTLLVTDIQVRMLWHT